MTYGIDRLLRDPHPTSKARRPGVCLHHGGQQAPHQRAALSADFGGTGVALPRHPLIPKPLVSQRESQATNRDQRGNGSLIADVGRVEWRRKTGLSRFPIPQLTFK